MLVLEFISVLLCSFTVMWIVLRPKQSEKHFQHRLQTNTLTRTEQLKADNLGLFQPRADGPLTWLGECLQHFDFSDGLQELIAHAGSKATVGSVIGGSFLAAVGAGLIAHVCLGFLPVDLAAIAAGAASRTIVLKFQRGRRLKSFDTALPDAIDLIARALRAGHSMSSSLEIVAEQSAEPLASEFAIVFQQQKFGMQFRDALLQLADRVPSKDLQFLVTAILVQKETGGDLTEILDRTTRIIRERVRIQGEIQTYTAQGRLTGLILSAMPIAMLGLINIMTPGYSHILFHDPLGQKLLYGGCFLIALGAFVIRQIVNIQV